jgi:hypothetical protein
MCKRVYRISWTPVVCPLLHILILRLPTRACYVLVLQTWKASKALGPQTHIVTAAFSSLREVQLDRCTIDGATFITSLLLCCQLQLLELSRCPMTPAAITALPALQRMQQLKELKWSGPERGQDRVHPCVGAAATLSQLAHLTQLTHITLARPQAATTSLIATVTGMANLMSSPWDQPSPYMTNTL